MTAVESSSDNGIGIKKDEEDTDVDDMVATTTATEEAETITTESTVL